MALIIHQAMTFTCTPGTSLGSTESISLVVLFLKALPITKLVLPLDDELGH
jgi:hypothetical protein